LFDVKWLVIVALFYILFQGMLQSSNRNLLSLKMCNLTKWWCQLTFNVSKIYLTMDVWSSPRKMDK
jgi:hypothetical protein